MLNFSYVAEQLGDDMAVGALERLLQSVQAVKDEGKVPGDWDRHLVWLNDVLSEVWQNRGPFPGIGSVLQYLGCESGTAFQRQVLVPVAQQGRERLGIRPGDSRRSQEVRAEAVRKGAEAGGGTLGGLQGATPQAARSAGPLRIVACTRSSGSPTRTSEPSAASAARTTRSSPILTCSRRWTRATASPT